MDLTKKAGPSEPWFQILALCRQFEARGSENGQREFWFTSEDIAGFVGFEKKEKATPAQIASAWLGKFCAWGYLQRGEPQATPGKAGRPTSTYRLTKEGWECEERGGKLTVMIRLDRLIKAVLDFEAARGKPGEPAAYKALVAMRAQVQIAAKDSK